MPGQDDVVKWTRDYDELGLTLLTCERLAYSYMAHLRHHAFPSPLLDWTESPYVAAYFAFAKAEDAHDVAVHIFVEKAELVKDQWLRRAKYIQRGALYYGAHEALPAKVKIHSVRATWG